MQANEILQSLMSSTGLSAAELSRATSLGESVVSRTLNGKTSPSFNSISDAARSLGFELTLTPLEESFADYLGPAMQEFVNAINQYSGTADQWTHISAGMRNALEFPDKQPSSFAIVTSQMDAQWRAFMAGFYDYQHWDKGTCDVDSLKLSQSWTPLRKIYRSATSPEPHFERYNVILPEGELQWR